MFVSRFRPSTVVAKIAVSLWVGLLVGIGALAPSDRADSFALPHRRVCSGG